MDLSVPDLMARLMASHIEVRQLIDTVETDEKYDLMDDLCTLMNDADKLIRLMWNHSVQLRRRANKIKAAPVQQTTNA